MNIELLIADPTGKKLYQPVIEDPIELTLERRSTPGKLTFKVVNDKIINFSEGSPVRLKVDGKPIFYGFVFSCKRDKEQLITVTAYDQLRYLKNKDTYVYENKTASQFIKMVADDFKLKLGTIENTGFVIASRVEENTTLFDMFENALDITLQNKKEMYVLYDDFGKLTLKNIASMRVGGLGSYLMIDEETGENFEYTSSIDSETYNQVKLTYDNDKTGKREVYITKDSKNINKWGILQYFDTLSEGENGKAKADALLTLYNSKKRNLTIKNAFGDTRVRAGSMLIVNLDLGDIKLKNFMLVEKVKHSFKSDAHFMDLTLWGGGFVA